MRERFNRRAFMAVPFLLGLFFIAGLSSVKAVTLYGVTATNQLVRFDSATSSNLRSTVAITGLQTSENVVGIDFRPATGQLFALGSSSRLYTINLTTGAATQVGAAGAFVLSGTNFGFDFNPVVDRIRVVSDTGQNLRINPADGTLSATDGTLNPATTGAAAAAYSNSFAGTTATTLYVIDTNSDTLYIQNPPNNGTLVSVGALGIDATGVNGFDIARGSNTAFATLTVGAATNLYTINLTTGRATLVGAVGAGTSGLRGLAVSLDNAASGSGRGTALDFDGDRRADYSVFRPQNNIWFILNSSNSSSNNDYRAVQFGLSDVDFLTPGDYDGDGRADISVWRSTTGIFYVLRSSDNTFQAFQFGQRGDEPVARDYDGDGRTDFAVARRADGSTATNGTLTFFINNSSNNSIRVEQFGLNTDIVAPGDYDGDGKFDLGVFRGGGADRNGPALFFVRRSTDNTTQVTQFGLGSDLIVPGDYDGDGRTDFAVVRTGTLYYWYIMNSSDNSVRVVQFGEEPDFTTQADYDGDGRTDISVFRPRFGIFYTLRSSDNGFAAVQFGQNGDIPVANYDTH